MATAVDVPGCNTGVEICEICCRVGGVTANNTDSELVPVWGRGNGEGICATGIQEFMQLQYRYAETWRIATACQANEDLTWPIFASRV